MITATQAIKTIETLKGFEFIRRENRFNRVKGKRTTFYVFDKGKFASIGQLRFYAEQIAYTHGVEIK